MMNRKQITIFVLFFTIFQCEFSIAQSYQKVFGRSDGNQQELYDIVAIQSGLYGVGTFRNISYFPDFAFYGSLCKLDYAGNLMWHKGYLPEQAVAFDSFFLHSLTPLSNGSLLGLGHLLGNELGGYYLTQFSVNGDVIWSKRIADTQADGFCKAVYGNSAIYAILGEVIVKMDLTGNILASRSINIDSTGNQSLTGISDIILTENNQLSIIGDTYYAEIWQSFELKMDENLDFISGHLYTMDNNAIAFKEMTASANGGLIIGTIAELALAIDAQGEIVWAKRFVPEETANSSNTIIAFEKIEPLNDELTDFLVLISGFYSDDTSFQYYSVLGDLKSSGAFSDFRTSSKAPTNNLPYDENTIPRNLITYNNYATFSMVGNMNYDLSTGHEHLNYLHTGNTQEMGCGEEAKTYILQDYTALIDVAPFPSTLISTATITTEPITMLVYDIPVTTDTTYCTLLAVNELPDFSVELFPNPAIDELTIHSDSPLKSIQLLNGVGEIVFSGNYTTTSSTIDLSTLSSGFYLVQLQNQSGKIKHVTLLKQ